MSELSNTELVELFSLMQRMLKATEAAEWDELSRLDGERRTLLALPPQHGNHTTQRVQSAANSVQPSCDTDGKVKSTSDRADLIEKITMLDQSILDVTRDARRKLLSENRDLSAQVKARNLYAQTSSIG